VLRFGMMSRSILFVIWDMMCLVVVVCVDMVLLNFSGFFIVVFG